MRRLAALGMLPSLARRGRALSSLPLSVVVVVGPLSLALLALMAAYALLLRPAGFLLATAGFLTLGGAILGERKFHILLPVAGLATGVVWYLVEQVLGIFLRPLPFFL